MTEPWDHDALWIKAKLFINRAMDTEHRDFGEQAMWASLALELLAKVALARVNPLLIASPTEDGGNLLAAAGLGPGGVRFKSVTAKTLYARCARAFKPFDERYATAIAESRNEYVHGATATFTDLPEEVWWSKFWAQATILVEASEQDTHALVGRVGQEVVEGYLAKNAQYIQDLMNARFARAARRLVQLAARRLPAKELERLTRITDHSIQLAYSVPYSCPVCASEGKVEGDVVSGVEVQTEQTDYEAWESYGTATVEAECFSCNNCALVLDSFELLQAADMPESFEVDVDPADFYEADYGND